MSHYSESERNVRVDFWKLGSGKWHLTEAVVWTGAYWSADADIMEAFKRSLRDHIQGSCRLNGLRATCLEPYHENSHPISIIIPEEGL